MSRTTKSLLVGVPVSLLLLAMAIPSFIPAHAVVARNACVNNLRWIEVAKQQWAVAGHKTTNDLPTEADLVPFLHLGDVFPRCPSGGTYTIGRVGELPTCSVGGVGHTVPTD